MPENLHCVYSRIHARDDDLLCQFTGNRRGYCGYLRVLGKTKAKKYMNNYMMRFAARIEIYKFACPIICGVGQSLGGMQKSDRRLPLCSMYGAVAL